MSSTAERVRPGPEPTARLIVEVFAIGRPGLVVVNVRDVGHVTLTRDEQIRTLRSAIETLEARR